MSNSIISLLPDKDKIKLTKDDLFDRIINLKLITGEYKDTSNNTVAVKHEEYVIRSDYEIIYPDLDVTRVMRTGNLATKRCLIRKCGIKPSIKIQYKNVSSSTSIGIDIFISNFFMTDSKGQRLMSFNNETYPLKQVEIMMGYWGQFKDMPHSTWADLQKFEPAFGVDKIVMNVQFVTTDKLPPDSVLHIHGWIGSNPYASEVQETPVTNFTALSEGDYIETVSSTLGNKSALESLFFKHITRRFLRDSVVESPVFAKNGFMSVADAEKYGVRVYCSKGVQRLSKENIEKTKLDTEGNEIPNRIFFNSGTTPDNTLANMLSLITADLVKKPLTDGNWLVCTAEESADLVNLRQSFIDVNGDYSKGTALVKTYKHILPAVYNVNVDAIATIVAPFFYFINIFDYVIFQNRYALSNLVSYYANFNSTLNKYFVVQQSISFATVEDVNEMTLICQASVTDNKGGKE